MCLKWYAPEPGSAEARDILFGDAGLFAPDILPAEVGNALWRRASRGDFRVEDCVAILDELTGGEVVRLEASSSFIVDGFRASVELRHPVYDCLYLALAAALDASLVTADRRLVAAVRGTPWEARVRLLGAE